MKKICSVFIAALLAVMLCVPVFAASDYCGCIPGEAQAALLYSDSGHYAYCLTHKKLTPCSAFTDQDIPHSDDCAFCASFSSYTVFVPYSFYERGVLFCDKFLSLYLNYNYSVIPEFDIAYQVPYHYFLCPDCGAYVECNFLDPSFPLHTEPDCPDCAEFTNNVCPLPVPVSPAQGILPAVSSIVTSAIDWLSAFALCIVSNPLLLVFVVCVFVGLGIGLVKRIIRL